MSNFEPISEASWKKFFEPLMVRLIDTPCQFRVFRVFQSQSTMVRNYPMFSSKASTIPRIISYRDQGG